MSLDRELNPWNFDIKFMPKFDSDHLESQIEAQIELKSAQKFKIQIWILKLSKPTFLGRELNFWNFGTKFMPKFNSECPETPIQNSI